METSKIISYLKQLSPFQYMTMGWLIALTVVMAILISNLLQAQAAVNSTLAQAADDLLDLAEARIQYTVHLSQTLPIETSIAINEDILVPVNLTVKHTIAVDNKIPFDQTIEVPVNLEINEIFPIDTTVPFNDNITVPVDQEITIDQVFPVPVKIPLIGETSINIPILAKIPVKFNVDVPIKRDIPIKAEIPVNFPVSKTLTVNINREVPVKMDIPINIPISTEVTVPFSRTIPIAVNVPIAMDVPLDIAISDTPFGEYLQNASQELRQAGNGSSRR